MTILTLYTREGCHLCEDMLADLEDLAVRHGFELELRDVDSRPDWRTAYDDKVPILFRKEIEICRYFLDPVAVTDALGKRS